MSVELWTINRWLRRIGLLLVVEIDLEAGEDPTIFRIVRAKRYPLR